ncbi:hypothetical protein DTO006G1_2796 [Penicillium roqueforti]|uniref:CAZyme family CE10 n=1 Tax=Penicillium roqueforti TaxID=5082 RepID=UPI00190C0D60|nr:CAZyme family CE10 [Penicillium roqueforti]KAF9252049.1 CAZyme family CE10 [Penicillium roqueforti]KAI1837318.1 hypothetical protein CBS147337_1601 [Penicillium roqueforti]KAI2687755.1 hypothetical protein LCP963914a_3273 [Penicillium roqueforti]KAI2689878.1 hypothetical protein CBS147355_329 [Penicillium roqueforti]KAI2762038.1 hypothetical protein DTO006G1_2796 [Penicillium roqueforti]
MSSNEDGPGPQLGFWEKADIPFMYLSLCGSLVYAAIAGVFRGKASPRRYDHYVVSAVVRKLLTRRSDRQMQYLSPSTPAAYEGVMKKHGLKPETVVLPHNTEGHWIGNKDAKNVIIYYHGGGFAVPAMAAYFEFWLDMLKDLDKTGDNLAVFFPRYSLTPESTYPTQMRQAVEALRYIINETGRSPSNVIIGGDSAGGNLAAATLLHLSHPHAEIKPLELSVPLAGVFAFSPWIHFSTDWPSIEENKWKDILPREALERWTISYRAGLPEDNWNQPFDAPPGWWESAKTERILILVGEDELLLSPIREFAKKVKAEFKDITFVIGQDESHDAPFFTMMKEETPTHSALREWLASRL